MGVNDQERLEAFEAFARDVRDELEQTNARMEELRKTADTMERLVDCKRWPYPSYGQIMYGV